MTEITQNQIERSDPWLTTPRFLFLLALLIVLNLFVYFWWFDKPVFAVGGDKVGQALIKGLETEKQSLQKLLNAECGSEGMRSYQRGEIGPLSRSRPDTTNKRAGETPSTMMPPPNQLVKKLDAATVRVLHEEGAGTGFFIDRNTVVTNRHVIEDAKKGEIYITSALLGPTPLKASILAMSQSSEFGEPDFALLKVDKTPESVQPLAIGTNPNVLQSVVAVGFPGLGTAGDANQITPNAVFTEGQVSVLQPQPSGMVLVVHTANMSRGSSGGPLVNRCGHVVGVNTFILTDKENVDGRSLYALSATNLRKFIEQAGFIYQGTSSECSPGQQNKAE